ncbi:MAG: translation elongation factor Ts [Candidatus Handelsmanbacteria bacterium RIFCSPLOWO2_12_FULL_64_10]|uniref:Elongation factor Ts n=1 Tax=Handelsmanbacteria sp. (strain RIFCSPLOWO2_12_FULL_64_10) TaxID=1817868 RepID=A0A1F6D3B4_HANXR|nr:MAG: translation elongation factor Ts [Candidatus Handelsmanbacteria bacterium RIFCSPLOWO2_12_FULL_64_10]
MAITSEMVKALRLKTNVGMMDCKKALEEAGGDMDKAVEILRKRGIAKAESRAGRVAKEGLIVSHLQPDNRLGVIVEVNSETDFVARTGEFRAFSEEVAAHVAAANPSEETFVKEPDKPIQDKLLELISKTGENISIRRFTRFVLGGEGVVTSYIHAGSKLGVLVEVHCKSGATARVQELQAFARDVAMQVAASNPVAVSREEIPPERVERERAIYREQAAAEGKPEKVLDRIVAGRLEKYYQDVCLLEQPFIKDPERTMKDLLTGLAAKVGEDISVRRFVRFMLGEEPA